MNILILCIFDETERNKKLLEIHRDNLSKHRFIKNNNIDYFFITFDENLTDDFKLIDDILFVKGKEDYMNILEKTIKSLYFFINIQNKYYDFIIRTNISSAFNFKLLHNYLTSIPKTNIYIGGIFFCLDWNDEKFNITKETIQTYGLHKLNFFQGTCIILSNDIVTYMLNNSNKLQYDIIDDVAIGLFIKTYLPNAYLTFTNVPITTKIYPDKKLYNDNSVLFRHKTFDDNIDIEYMKNTYKIINTFT
jgi:hypothetical protein